MVTVKARSMLGLLLSIAGVAFGQSNQIPPGVRHADDAEVQFEKNVPPPPGPIRARVNYVQRMKEARQLADIANSVLSKTQQTTNSANPKDLGQDLRRIEKLAHKLRGELQP